MSTIGPGSPGPKRAALDSTPVESRLTKPGEAAGPAAGKDTGGLPPVAGGAPLDTLERIAPSRMSGLLTASRSQGSLSVDRTHGSMANGDVMAMAFLVMMEAAKSAREDLKAIMDGVKSINEKKQELRGHAQDLRSAAEASRSSALAPGQASSGRLSLEGVDAAPEAIANDLDSLSEMGEMESFRLQMAMDRLSKMMETLSELLKKASDTSNSITQNLK